MAKILIFLLDESNFLELQKLYLNIDKDNDGLIQFPELRNFLNRKGLQLSHSHIKQIIEKLHFDQPFFINFTDFIIAVSNKQILFNHEHIQLIFDYLDTGKQGFITIDNLVMSFRRIGDEILPNEIIQILQQSFK